MEKINKKNKKIIKISIFSALAIIIISIVLISMLKYNVDGEQNLPFIISNVRIISTAEGINQEDLENRWNISITQKNDFYFYIEKNKDYSKDDSISKIIFENFNIETSIDKEKIGVYKPSTETILYNYSDEYKVEDKVIYSGSTSTNIQASEIGNQGGLIGFSIAVNDLGSYITNEDSEIIHNGTLLSKLNLSSDDIKMKVSFDIIIETSSEKSYKSSVSFDLPCGEINEEGISIYNGDNPDDFIFKRI